MSSKRKISPFHTHFLFVTQCDHGLYGCRASRRKITSQQSDGRHLAFGQQTFESNAWLLENF